MLSQALRTKTKDLPESLGRSLARTGVSANALTLLGFAGSLAAAYLAAIGSLRWAGGVMLVASSLDALDGAVARAKGEASPFGGFLDSFLDRLSESALFLGLLYLYLYGPAAGSSRAAPFLIYLSLVGSFMVSYARARAEGLGLDCKVGLFTRLERILVLALGLILRQVLIALWMVAILANLTALQRALHIWRMTRAGGAVNKPNPGGKQE